MPTATATRAWTDLEFRAGLTIDELDRVPEHPAGDLDEELRQLTSPQATGPTSWCTEVSTSFCCC